MDDPLDTHDWNYIVMCITCVKEFCLYRAEHTSFPLDLIGWLNIKCTLVLVCHGVEDFSDPVELLLNAVNQNCTQHLLYWVAQFPVERMTIHFKEPIEPIQGYLFFLLHCLDGLLDHHRNHIGHRYNQCLFGILLLLWLPSLQVSVLPFVAVYLFLFIFDWQASCWYRLHLAFKSWFEIDYAS